MRWNEKRWDEINNEFNDCLTWHDKKSEIKWNELEWYKIIQSEVKWDERWMACNRMHWNELEWNGMKWNRMKWNGMEWNEMKWNETEFRNEWVGRKEGRNDMCKLYFPKVRWDPHCFLTAFM